MTIKLTVAPFQVSHPSFMPAGTIVTITPGSGATATVEYTKGSAADLQNNVAIWAPWAKGAVSAVTQDIVSHSGFLRVTALGGTVAVDINKTPVPAEAAALTTTDWAASVQGATLAATISGTPSVGSVLTAKLPSGVTGTMQWTRTLAATPFTKSNISGAVASAVNSLAYTVQSADIGCNLGVDCSNQVSSTTGSLISASAISTYLGQVATGTFAYDGGTGAANFIGTKSPHYMREDITPSNPLSPLWTNWAIVSGAEAASFAAFTITACVEYPSGTKTEFTFGGQRAGTVPVGSNLIADPLPITIPNGAKFWIYTRVTATGSSPYFSQYAGDGTAQTTVNASAASVPDLTAAGSTGSWTAITTNATGAYVGPTCILANTTKRSVYIGGDSKSIGATDANNGSVGQGHLGRAFAPVAACAQLGKYGDAISGFITSHTRRIALAQYFTHVAVDFGINDVTTGRTAVQVQADTNTYLGYFGSKPIAVCTLSPVTTGTFTSDAGQTTHANNAVRVAVNTQRLTNLPLAQVIYDVNPAVESVASPESGLWISTAGLAFTSDGTHYNTRGATAAAAIINPQLLLAY